MMKQTFLARRNDDMDLSKKGETSRRYQLSSERKNNSKICNLLGKEEQVKDMESP